MGVLEIINAAVSCDIMAKQLYSRWGQSCHIYTWGFSTKHPSDFLQVTWEKGSIEQMHVQVTMKGLQTTFFKSNLVEVCSGIDRGVT